MSRIWHSSNDCNFWTQFGLPNAERMHYLLHQRHGFQIYISNICIINIIFLFESIEWNIKFFYWTGSIWLKNKDLNSPSGEGGFSGRKIKISESPETIFSRYLVVKSNRILLSGIDSIPVPSALQGLVNPEVS